MLSRRVYRLNTTEYINQYLQEMAEWRRQSQIAATKESIRQTRQETQQLISQLDTIARKTELSKLPPATFVIDLDANNEAAKRISKLSKEAMKQMKIFKPEEIPLATIIEDYIPAFKDSTEPIDPQISASVGHEIRIAVREKLESLGFEGVDESAHILRGAIPVILDGKKTDVANVVAIGKDGNIYFGHPDKHPPAICDAVVKKLREELSEPIRIATTRGLKKLFKEGARLQPISDSIRLERESCG